MEKVFSRIKMVIYLMGIGSIIKKMVKEYLSILMGRNMRANGCRIRGRDMGSLPVKMGKPMMESGSRI